MPDFFPESCSTYTNLQSNCYFYINMRSETHFEFLINSGIKALLG